MGGLKNRESWSSLWVMAWLFLAIALAVHVVDEALTGFLPLYNEVVGSLRATYSWLPLPTFTFRVWLAGLIVLVAFLLALTPLVVKGWKVMLVLSYILGGIMIANAIGHISASLWFGAFAPGVYSSPLLLVAAVALLAAVRGQGQNRTADTRMREESKSY
jgi:hypothetical protein